MARWAALLEPYAGDLQFTVHASDAANPGQGDPDEELLRACVETAAAIGAKTLVIHPFRQSMHTIARKPLTQLLARERDALRRLADLARPSGLKLALETYTPPTRDEYCYAMWPGQLVEQVQRIDDPNVGICIDTGHTFLSAQFCGFDFAEAIERLADRTIHTHVQDTLGLHDPRNYGMGEEQSGVGDAHLAPGTGSIPLEVLASLPEGVPLLAELPRMSSFAIAAEVYEHLTALGTRANQ